MYPEIEKFLVARAFISGMTIRRKSTVVALTGLILAAGTTAAFAAKPDPREKELEARSIATVKYFCNTPHHDEQFYNDWATVSRMSVWNFTDNASPYDEAVAAVSGSAGSGTEHLLGTEPTGLTDATRTRICTDRRKEFLDTLDKVTDEKIATLKVEYRNNDAGLKQFPFTKLDAFDKVINAEKSRAR
ncbi:hypothetical protein G3I40_27810 [Streptomyces sp. SID14478]|uniref:hypothetical protein n=1 Tax=Streptomyces sp. SID14478 TaxID=2706073 RepID=UPI0013DC67AC|nr:hypothetical protein [Streptomyces sp. SID14478]NEB78996.1 hypothetical protein [Streptomyces sp. SID14478]